MTHQLEPVDTPFSHAGAVNEAQIIENLGPGREHKEIQMTEVRCGRRWTGWGAECGTTTRLWEEKDSGNWIGNPVTCRSSDLWTDWWQHVYLLFVFRSGPVFRPNHLPLSPSARCPARPQGFVAVIGASGGREFWSQHPNLISQKRIDWFLDLYSMDHVKKSIMETKCIASNFLTDLK